MGEGAACDDGAPTTLGDLCWAGACRAGVGRQSCRPGTSASPRVSAPWLLIDSSAHGYGYAYGPSMLWSDGAYRAWYCSSGAGATDWDHVRYSTASELRTWSAPIDLVRTTDPVVERAVCDPSIVRFAGFWYMFYSGCQVDVQTVHFVARAPSPTGPFAKYTRRGTFEVNAPDPAVIRAPFHAAPENSNWYGTGQASVVNRGDLLYIWLTDTTESYPGLQTGRIYFTRTTDPKAWPPAVFTHIDAASIDVMWDDERQHFELTSLAGGHTADARVERYYSRDGAVFSGPFAGEDAPNFSNNPGVLRDPRGHRLHAGMSLVAYGAPYDLANDLSWAAWDLHAHSRTDPVVVTGDFDGDGKTDRAIVDRETPAGATWFVLSSSTGQPPTDIPWGDVWTGFDFGHALTLGDFDGDGKTERAMVSPQSRGSGWTFDPVLTSPAPFESGWRWPAMGDHLQILVGDFDGDGVADRTVADPDTGGCGVVFYSLPSSGGNSSLPWGTVITPLYE